MTNGSKKPRSNRPGHSARQIAKRRHLQRALIGLSATMLLFVALTFIPFDYEGFKSWGILLGILIAALIADRFVNSKIDHITKWERKALRGAAAEETIGALLEQVQEPRALFHDVDTGYGDIDHILLSPDLGVILIETKSHHGTVEVIDGILLINGRPPEKDFIRQTLRNTLKLRARIEKITGIEVWIQPIIVFTNAFVREWSPVQGIRLRNQKYLLKAIEETSFTPAIASRLWALHEQGKPLW